MYMSDSALDVTDMKKRKEKRWKKKLHTNTTYTRIIKSLAVDAHYHMSIDHTYL